MSPHFFCHGFEDAKHIGMTACNKTEFHMDCIVISAVIAYLFWREKMKSKANKPLLFELPQILIIFRDIDFFSLYAPAYKSSFHFI